MGEADDADATTTLGGGSIVIHKGGSKTKASVASTETDPALVLTDGVAPDVAELPTEYGLDQNYPNPFNPVTEIRYALPEAVHVRLIVYDALGREVARLVDGVMAAGVHRAQWQAGHFPSGVYLYRITAGAFTEVRPMVLMK